MGPDGAPHGHMGRYGGVGGRILYRSNTRLSG
jgi:hypothetical protein